MKNIKLSMLVVFLFLRLSSSYCQVPNTTTFSLQTVQTNVPGSPNNLVGCFNNADNHNFDPAYASQGNSLLRFRNYHYRHYLGESYQGGKIFYLYPDGLSGLICGPSNLGSTEYPFCRWFNGFNRASISTSYSIGTGKQNTNNILSTIGASGWAAKACVDYRGGGYSDWYLPSLDETWEIYYALYYSHGNLNGFFPTDALWSSTQADAVYAWCTTMSGTERFEDDYNYERVRPIRKFVDNIPLYYSAARSVSATKNICGEGYTGSTETYYLPYAAIISEISQADADDQAIFYAASHAQAYANSIGTCTPIPVYYSSAMSTPVQRNDCAEGYIAGTVNFSSAYGAFSSTISQADANAQASAYIVANAQAYANANATCTPAGSTFWNTYMAESFQKQGCESSGMIGQWVETVVLANFYSSSISVTDANAQAETWLSNNGQNIANATGVCYPGAWLSLSNIWDYDGISPNGSVTITLTGANNMNWVDLNENLNDLYYPIIASSGEQTLAIEANADFVGTRMVFYNYEYIGDISAYGVLHVYNIPYDIPQIDVAIGDINW